MSGRTAAGRRAPLVLGHLNGLPLPVMGCAASLLFEVFCGCGQSRACVRLMQSLIMPNILRLLWKT